LAATVAVFATVVVLVLWANKPVYKTLYSDMSEDDIQQVTAALDGKNIPYRQEGGNLEVQGSDVYAVRLDLAEQGLPKNAGTGFELFDDSRLGMTEFMQNVNYQRALQGELARSIMTLNEVVQANVHLSIPKDRIFVTDDDESKASVVVRLAPGKQMGPDGVRAITHLVASAVRGLKPESVQVLDTNGNLLSDFLSEDRMDSYVTQTQLEQQRQVERELENKLQAILSRTLGADKYVARVHVEMDFNKKSIETVEYSDTPVVRSTQNIETTSRDQGRVPEGIPGVEPNLAEPNALIDGIMRDYSYTNEIANYEISTTTTHETKNHGIISRLTVSVVVDDRPQQNAGDNGTVTVTRVARTDDELARIRTAVASAVGYDEARGDIVDVTNISFDMAEFSDEMVAVQKEKVMGWITVAAKYVAAVLILLLFYLLLVRPIMSRLENAKELDEEIGESALDAQLASMDISVGDESGFPKTVEELEREIESELSESVPVDVEAVKSKVMLKKIEEASQDDPEMIANLVKALIKGG
jgi:flagellar M-ring protein FliF